MFLSQRAQSRHRLHTLGSKVDTFFYLDPWARNSTLSSMVPFQFPAWQFETPDLRNECLTIGGLYDNSSQTCIQCLLVKGALYIYIYIYICRNMPIEPRQGQAKATQ